MEVNKISIGHNFKVLVRCMTYNHSQYIQYALNSFAMQQTSFPFLCVVMDDCSTDGAQEVLMEWISQNCDNKNKETSETSNSLIIAVNHKTNPNCKLVFFLLKRNLWKEGHLKNGMINPLRKECLYEAFCEGDDYWIDPLKLEKQVAAIESNDNISMVYTDYVTVDENNESIFRPEYDEMYKKFHHSGDNLPTLFRTNYPLTVTCLMRTSIFFDKLYTDCPSRLDYFQFMACALRGDFIYVPDKTAAYRKNTNSLMHTASNAIKRVTLKGYPFMAIKYLDGNTKHEGFVNDVCIKYHILNKALQYKYEDGLNDFFKEVIQRSLICKALLPFCFIRFYIRKIVYSIK